MSRLLGLLGLLGLLSCAQDPDPCDDMCAVAASVQCSCLDEWEADWTDIGYRDQAGFFGSCQTWAWEMRLLEEDALSRGEVEALGAVDRSCESRTSVLEDAQGCDDWTAIDWSTTPWN